MTSQSSTEPAARSATVPYGGLIIVATSLGLMMDGIDVSGVSVANPVIGRELGATLPQLQWVTNGYLLAMAAALITGGKLGDRWGHRRLFLTGMIGFAASSAVAGLSSDIRLLIAMRVIQGLFGAALMPTSLAILRLAFPPDKLKQAIGISGGMIALASTGGPAIGGLLVEYAGWRWIFFTNVPVAVIVVALTAVAIPDLRADHPTRPRIDVPGVVLLALTLVGLVWALIASPVRGWSDAAVLASLVVAVVAGVLFVLRQQRTGDPLLPLTLFRSARFSAGAVVLILAGMVIFGTIFYLVFYLQQVKSLSAVKTGLILLTCTGMFAFGAPAGGTLNQRYGGRLPVTIGLVLMIIGAVGLSSLQVDSSLYAVWPFLMAAGLGMGFVAPTAVELVVGGAPERYAGVAGGVQHTAGMLGTALGTAVFGVLVTVRAEHTLPGRLADAGAPASAGSAVNGGEVGQAAAQLPPGTSPDVAGRIARAVHEAFVDGFHVATWSAVGLALAALIVAQFVHTAPQSLETDQTVTAAL
jgi:EmrB/QacA subfamily drug resistance transporter